MTTTPETIAELKRLLAKATPGPWEKRPYIGDEDWCISVCARPEKIGYDRTKADWICDVEDGDCEPLDTTPAVVANAGLICAAVNALPSLLSDLEAAQKREQVLRERVQQVADSDDMRTSMPCHASLLIAALAATEAA
jgi:hypothetical protein